MSTLAGVCGPDNGGFLNGPADQARFKEPEEIDLDTAQRIYIAEMDNHCVRVVSGGQVTTLAGTCGQEGYEDDSALLAKFYTPHGIAVADVDGQVTVYVAELYGARVRKIQNGQVSTLSGSAYCDTASGQECVDGAATQATFGRLHGLLWDGAGKLYVGDNCWHAVRTVSTTDGQVQTILGGHLVDGYGEGTGRQARFTCPYGMARDGAGFFYVVDRGNHRIRAVSYDSQMGTYTTSLFAGNGFAGSVDAPVLQAEFDCPEGITLDPQGKLYVTEQGGNRIRAIFAGQVTTVAGSGQAGYRDGALEAAEFNGPTGIRVLADGRVVIADTSNHCLRVLRPRP